MKMLENEEKQNADKVSNPCQKRSRDSVSREMPDRESIST